MMKKISTVLFTSILIFAFLTACGSSAVQNSGESTAPAQTGTPKDLTGGVPWIDSVVVGSVTADTEVSPTEDFYLYVNKDWIVSEKLPDGSPTLDYDVFAESRERVQKALAGEDLSEHDAHQAQLLYKAFLDTEEREEAGCEPAGKVIDDIRSISSIDELNDFLLDIERSAGVPTLIEVHNKRNNDEHRWETRIRLSDATFGSTVETMEMDAETVDPESDNYKARLALVKDVLTRVGYTEQEAEDAFKGRLELEKEIIQIAREKQGEEDGPSEADISELNSLAGDFPLRELAETRGYASAESFKIGNEAELRAIGELYTEEHLDELRDYLICGYAMEAAGWLDTEALDAWRADYDTNVAHVTLTMPERNTKIEETALNIVAEVLPTPTGRAYVEAYDLSDIKKFVEELSAEAVEAHKKIVNDSEWLSETSKQQLTEKLDAITMKVVYPDAWEDFSGLDLDGLDYYDARRAIWLNNIERNTALTGTEIDDRLWEEPALIEGGGSYDSLSNSFRVDAGPVEREVERYRTGEITLEELLGGTVGYVVFHEIGHALDPGNIYYDKNGDRVEESLLDPSDVEEYTQRRDKARKYFDGISVWEGQNVDGSICLNEAAAEICGMQARLAYAAKQDDFDYQKFFGERTKSVRTLHTPEYELECLMGADRHPSAYLDVNVTVQQFDEFAEAYDVKEGDTMYLAPGDRIVIW